MTSHSTLLKTLFPLALLLAASSAAAAGYQLRVPLGYGQGCAGGACAGGGPATPAGPLAISLAPGEAGDRLVATTGGVAPYAYGLVFESMTEPAATCDIPATGAPAYATLNNGPAVATCESTESTWGITSITLYVHSENYDANNETYLPGTETYLQLNKFSFGYDYRVVVIDAEGNTALTPTFTMPPLPPM